MKKTLTILSLFVLVAFTIPKELELKLSIQETETVLKALSKLPYEESAPVISKIQYQAQKQLTDTIKQK